MGSGMRVLGIETTCDETAAAVVRLRPDGSGEILADELMSQIAAHAPFGGVVPEIAARAHVEIVDLLIARALTRAKIAARDLDGVAAAAGPGLIGGVLVGLMAGKGVALACGKPFVAVNHLEAHALTARLTDSVAFPFLVLIASGGHTQISRSKALAITTASARPWTTLSAKPSTRPPNSGFHFQADPQSRPRRGMAIQHDSHCLALCSGGRTRIFPSPASKRPSATQRNRSRPCARGTWRIFAPRFRRRSSTWSRIAFGWD